MSTPHEPLPATANLPLGQILIGDARTRLAELSDGSIDCVITSPPYFALRDYGEPGQLGLEPTIEDWVRNLVSVAKEIRRVLKPTGGFWLNVADSYAHHPKEGAAKKSLLLGPARLALALVADGWLLRTILSGIRPIPCPATSRIGSVAPTRASISSRARAGISSTSTPSVDRIRSGASTAAATQTPNEPIHR